MLRIDGTIARAPTGQGHKSRYLIGGQGKEKEEVFRSDDPGLDLAYISVDELAPGNDETLRDKLRSAYRDYAMRGSPEEVLADYFDHLAKLCNTAIVLNSACEHYQGDEANLDMLKLGMERYLFHGDGQLMHNDGLDDASRAIVLDQAQYEMRRLFPDTPDLANAIEASDEYPYIRLNRRMLSEYFDSSFPNITEIDVSVDQAMEALRSATTKTTLSFQTQHRIAQVKRFPDSIQDERLKPLFTIPFNDESTVIQLSPGAFISDWEPALTLQSGCGCYQPRANTVRIPAAAQEIKDYDASEALSKPLLPFFETLPISTISRQAPHSLDTIYFEEFFHCAMQAVFHNNCQPFAATDEVGKQAHIDAIIADATEDGETPSASLVKELGLESYMDGEISFREHLQEGVRAGSNKNILAEVVAKIAASIENEGWGKTRAQFPHLCADFEERIFPQCHDLAKSKEKTTAFID